MYAYLRIIILYTVRRYSPMVVLLNLFSVTFRVEQVDVIIHDILTVN